MATIPKAHSPRLVQLYNWIFDPLDYLESNLRQHGDMFEAQATFADWIFLSHPDSLKYVLTHDGKELSAPGEYNEILAQLLGRNSLMLLSGDQHRQRRQLVMPPFHGERLRVYGDLIRTITREAIADLKPGQEFKARQLTQKISMQIILQAVFGLRSGERAQHLGQLLTERLDVASGPLGSALLFFPLLRQDYGTWSPGHRLKAMSDQIDALIFAEIRDRRANPDGDRSDILSLLLAARDAEGQGLSDQELRDELMTLLVAGHETTATAIAWSLYWAHSRPDVGARLRSELQTANSADPVALTKLPYLNAVCNETLRIYPIAMLTFPRRVEQPITLQGYDLSPDQVVVGSIYLLHRRPDLYPSPDQFRPERFLERQFGPFEFMPFGAGARRCVGAALAMYEMTIVLATLLQDCELELASDAPVEPQRRGVTLSMKGGVDMVYQGRRSATELVEA
ncbi:MAG: cytochrome P450 [Nodosilinea sp.]